MKSSRNFLLILMLGGLSACDLRLEMYDNGRIKPLEGTVFFADERTARPLVEGTIARGALKEDELLHTGRIGGKLVNLFPFPMDSARLDRGRERFNIFCSVCHGLAGMGDGMIVRRGFPRPTSFHDPRLVAAPAGYFFDAITNGWGRMYSYASQIEVEDRWAIVAYVRALQRSQAAKLNDVPEDARVELEGEAK